MHLIRRLLHLRLRLRSEEGYTLVAVMGVMAAVSALSVAAFAASDGDFRTGVADKERKQAYAAAEAGVADYLARLVARPDYWRDCANDTGNLSLNQVNPTPAARRWATVATTTSQYSVELLPANGRASCDPSDPVASFIDADTGTFRIRATGRPNAAGGMRRSIVATFKRRGFLDYIYFTDLETTDPVWYRRAANDRTTRGNPVVPATVPPTYGPSIVDWGLTQCGRYWRAGRSTATNFVGNDENRAGQLVGTDMNSVDAWDDLTQTCGEIRFFGDATSRDRVDGPLHTNDELLLCGTPHFGRRPGDDIEISGPGPASTSPGWRQDGGCSGEPQVNDPGEALADRGTLRRNSPLVTLPPSNASLRDDALPAYRFVGRTTIVMNGTQMTVTGKRANGTVLTAQSMPMPIEGVIHVANDTVGTCSGYNPSNPYAAQPACGDVWIRGTYDKSLTVTADNDIVIDEDIAAAGAAKPLLGLISNNWIRVYHPSTNSCNDGPGPITIEAAILSLNHSFTVDNYFCGAKIGNLTVIGAIGQKYRGPVGTGGASGGGTGYIKDYRYNDDLRFRSPPRFLDPVQTTWKLRSQVEQVPAS